eukprot:CAMPEP_0198280830 /NCGR_PEP_ID=MMETSP1449-20131203/869_1 /TAXON_ID=420275 /ORGANISM="Attheya septentrionalis, Strain CCMP2084" /LENGTH=360 /DNA_ID=CAMNT_0043976359 /DNA_START=77 /DNA_END=1159 /DNA_ORIENTATION=-
MKFIFLSLSAISLLSSVSEAWKEDGRCWDLICAKKGKKERANQKPPDGPFQDGITCDCLSGGSRSCGGGRALTSEGDSELYMWTNNTNNEIDTFDFMHDEELEDTNQVDEQELTEFDDEDLISHMDSPNLSSGIVGGAEAQRNLEADNERKETLRQLKNDNRKRRRRRKRKNRKNDKKDKTGAPTMTNPKAPTKAPTSGPPSGGASKLALGWRAWSCWQYETKKRDWCATRRGGTSNLEIQDCDDDDIDKWTFNKVGTSNYVTIRHEKQDLCWTKSGTSLLLKSCVKNSAAQEWDLDSSYKSHTNLGAAGDHLFEIQPAHSQKDCVTQNHHPKGGEKLSAQPCATSRKLGHQTNYWEKVN